MPIASNNPFPSMLYVEGTTPASPSAGQQRLFVRSSDHVLCMVNSSGVVTPLSGSLTNPMTTAEDIIVGGAAGAPARKAVGAAGAALSVINGAVAWNSGTSFPGSKATGDRYWRTDLAEEFFWDGTRWRCTTQHRLDIAQTDHILPISADTFAISSLGTDLAAYLVKGWFAFLNSGTNNGTNFWSCQLFSKTSGSSGSTNRGSAVTTAASAASQWLLLPITLGIAMATTEVALGATVSKTLNPGALYWAAHVYYNHIAT